MLKDLTIRQNRLLGVLAAFSLVVLMGNLLAVLRLGNQPVTHNLLNISIVIASFASTIALLYAALKSSPVSRRMVAACSAMAAAQFFLTLDNFLRYLILGGSVDLAGGIVRLVYAALFFGGIILLPVRSSNRIESTKGLLDRLIVMVSIMLWVWNFISGPILQALSGQTAIIYINSLGYSMGSLVLLWAVLVLFYSRPDSHPSNPLFLICGALILMVVTDLAYSYLSILQVSPRIGFVELGWITSSFLIAAAGLWQGFLIPAHHSFNLFSGAEASPGKLTAPKPSVIPYIFLVADFFLLFWSYRHPLPMNSLVLVSTVAFINILVLLRQSITIYENNQLYQELKEVMDKVSVQTDQLSQVNRNLQVEVEERKRAEEQLVYDALHDSLTGLPNRALFIDRLNHTIEYTRRHPDYHFAVLFLDLDYFKIINDSLGHGAGDQLLVAFANRLRLCMRLSDTVARLGGDEFVIMLEDTKEEGDVISAARRIEERLKSPFTIEGREVYITASIGIVKMGNGYGTSEDILRDADIAMYSAKSLGKSRYEIFTPGLRDKAMMRLEMENDLRSALEHSEFFLVYQPILSFANNEISGFEALLRWNHPKRGLVQPMEFIPTAEEIGLISPIGNWVLHEGCRQICKWHKQFPSDPPLNMSINVSGSQLIQPDFVEQVKSALAENGLSGSSLSLEITERVCLNGTEEIKDIFAELSKLGVQFHIDDFGVGYSSLSYLQNFPIQMLKIDRSFTEKIDDGAYNCEIVRSIISLAHDLGMGAIAEGVETEKQLFELRKFGCNYGQGYLLSYPLTPDRIEQLINSLPAGETSPTSHPYKLDL